MGIINQLSYLGGPTLWIFFPDVVFKKQSTWLYIILYYIINYKLYIILYYIYIIFILYFIILYYIILYVWLYGSVSELENPSKYPRKHGVRPCFISSLVGTLSIFGMFPIVSQGWDPPRPQVALCPLRPVGQAWLQGGSWIMRFFWQQIGMNHRMNDGI